MIFLMVIGVTSIFRSVSPGASLPAPHHGRLTINDLTACLRYQRPSQPVSRAVIHTAIDVLAALHALLAGFSLWLIYDL